MASLRAVGLELALALGLVRAQVTGNNCSSSTLGQSWSWSPDNGTLVSGNGQCLTSSSWPASDGTALVMSPCTGSPAQSFDVISSNSTIMSRFDPAKCVNLAGYGTTPGTAVWLYGCVPPNYTCEGNCDWHPAPDEHFVNAESGLCLDDGGPPMPHTCAPGSAAVGLPFCDTSLSFAARAADLVARLTREAKEALYVLPLPVSAPALVNRRCGWGARVSRPAAAAVTPSPVLLQPRPRGLPVGLHCHPRAVLHHRHRPQAARDVLPARYRAGGGGRALPLPLPPCSGLNRVALPSPAAAGGYVGRQPDGCGAVGRGARGADRLAAELSQDERPLCAGVQGGGGGRRGGGGPPTTFATGACPPRQGLNAEGGPLANTIHDPRWGRIQVCYDGSTFHGWEGRTSARLAHQCVCGWLRASPLHAPAPVPAPARRHTASRRGWPAAWVSPRRTPSRRGRQATSSSCRPSRGTSWATTAPPTSSRR